MAVQETIISAKKEQDAIQKKLYNYERNLVGSKNMVSEIKFFKLRN